jgi:hypothetical protein
MLIKKLGFELFGFLNNLNFMKNQKEQKANRFPMGPS